MLGVDAVFAIVGGAFGAVAEDVVGGGDTGEARRGFRVARIAVWVMMEGERVEFSDDAGYVRGAERRKGRR
jgi:hypothetical protein